MSTDHDWADGVALAAADESTKLRTALRALRETLRVIESIDYVVDQFVKDSVESAVIGATIRSCTMRLRRSAEPFVESIEQAGLV